MILDLQYAESPIIVEIILGCRQGSPRRQQEGSFVKGAPVLL